MTGVYNCVAMRRPLLQFVLALLGGIAIATAHAEAPAACSPASHAQRFGTAAIVYDVVGSGPVVLLVHGLFADKEQWTALACSLAAAGFTAIAVDLPGYGASTGFPLADYRLDRQVEQLRALTQRLGLERLHLAGNSMGGAIAALYASRYPRQVASLAFIGSPLGIVGWNQPLRDAIFAGFNPFIPVTGAQLEAVLSLLFARPPAIPEQRKAALVADYASRNRHYVQVWNIVNLYGNVLWQRPAPRVPALIVWGEQDRVFSVNGAQRLARRIPGSAVHTLPDAGHLLHMESAAAVAPLYVEFLRSK
jgi:pimeloyl-ACP methyl ester carboxylesterase